MSYHIISDTLPTVIGMGVTSRAVDTMFGKGGKGGKGRIGGGGVSAKGKKFNGKVYRPANWHTTKASADRDAEYFRKAGHNARVVKEYNPKMKRWGYMVYVR